VYFVIGLLKFYNRFFKGGEVSSNLPQNQTQSASTAALQQLI